MSLRETCENEDRAIYELDVHVAKNLKSRLADLRAATSVTELIAGQPREIEGPCHPNFEVDLGGNYLLVFCANHKNIPVLESSAVDWSQVRRVKILRIYKNNG